MRKKQEEEARSDELGSLKPVDKDFLYGKEHFAHLSLSLSLFLSVCLNGNTLKNKEGFSDDLLE